MENIEQLHSPIVNSMNRTMCSLVNGGNISRDTDKDPANFWYVLAELW